MVANLGFFDENSDMNPDAPLDPLFSQAAASEVEETKMPKKPHPAHSKTLKQVKASLTED